MKKIKHSFVEEHGQDNSEASEKTIDRSRSLNITLDYMYLGSDCNLKQVQLIRAASFLVFYPSIPHVKGLCSTEYLK